MEETTTSKRNRRCQTAHRHRHHHYYYYHGEIRSRPEQGGGIEKRKKKPASVHRAPRSKRRDILVSHWPHGGLPASIDAPFFGSFFFFLFSFLFSSPSSSPPPQRSRAACLDSPPDIFSRGAYLCLCFVSYLSHQTDERLPEMLSTPATARRRCPTTHCTSQKHISVLSGSSPFHQSPASGPLAPSPLGPANTVARGAQTDPPLSLFLLLLRLPHPSLAR